MKLSNKEVRGTLDRFPEEFEIRKYIFDTRRKVCKQFGYEEYLAPLVENADIYIAKSGEDVGGTELTLLTDRKGEISNIALRPEMTPSIMRMITKKYTQLSKPIRYFSIANFYRNERPQRGRNREFWQLNIDLFGSKDIQADIEILQMGMELIRGFNTPKDSWELHINNRKIIDYILNSVGELTEKQKIETVRTMDKWNKLSIETFTDVLGKRGLAKEQIDTIIIYMQTKTLAQLTEKFPNITDNIGYKEMLIIIKNLDDMGYSGLFKFDPSLIRGFDYYDGMVFEVFDKHPDNNRAMFGGGRYNGLSEIFGIKDIPSVGFAPGDESMKLFLESRGLLDKFKNKYKEIYYIPVLNEELKHKYYDIAQKLRLKDKNVLQGLELQRLNKALHYTNKNMIKYIIIFDKKEKEKDIYKIKNLKTGAEETISIND